jgi:transcriptional regulator with XRE-family HTH domain
MPDSSLPDLSYLHRLAIGAQIRRARLEAGRSTRELAKLAGLPSKRLAALEAGEAEPALGELEALAHYLHVPIDDLMRDNVIDNDEPRKQPDFKMMAVLRQRIIGARLKQARLDKGESLTECAEAMGLSRAQLHSIEMGRRPLPVSRMLKLMAHYNISVDQLLDLGIGPVGEKQLRMMQHGRFDALPEDVKAFITEPASLPYLQAAMHLSQLPKEQVSSAARVLSAISEMAERAEASST